jgi:hypothetical protein
MRCIFDSLPFTPGGYSVVLTIFDHDDMVAYDHWGHAASFLVESRPSQNVRWHLSQEEHGVVYLSPVWENRPCDVPTARIEGIA